MTNTKFKPSNVPGWCGHIAQDENGDWYAYDCKPKVSNDSEVWVANGKFKFLYKSTPPLNFKNELYTWE